ncbi:MAG: nuclear transport factor 2 family protein [Balneola sp.]|nr:MAG: nuclear transport factor 2 family protein [Balneola sp.]
MSNKDLIVSFYNSFARKDFENMGIVYDDRATFDDPAFSLKGREIAAMWHMLCERGRDLEITFEAVKEEGGYVYAHWEAIYSFSLTKRKVHNKIDARFRFEDQKVIEHIDTFNFWRWSSQALGTPGIVLGWSPFLKNRVRKQAADSLTTFISKNPKYQAD